MKVCKACERMLPLDSYWKQSNRKDGKQAKCIDCMTASHTAWSAQKDGAYRAERTARNVQSMNRIRIRNPLEQMYRSIKSRAKKAGLEFTIELSDIVIPSRCPVLGIEISFGTPRGAGLAARDCRPSVDRIDNSRGYTRDNIIVVSYRANRIKSDATLRELLAVATFYSEIENEAGRRGDKPAVVIAGGVSNDLPGMLGAAEEENGPVPECEAGRGGLPVLLLALRA